MADVKCPSCGKINPEELEICQFCGTLLKQTRTEPLAPLLPGQFPEKKATSDLERTLPGWLRDARRAANEPSTSPIPLPRVPQATTPPVQTPPPAQPKKPAASPLDLLAGLSQAADEEEEVPDWLKNLQGSTPAPTAPVAPEPAQPETATPDWFAELQEPAAEPEKAPQPEAWGFSSEPIKFDFDETGEAPLQSAGETPDWLSALQAQETSAPQNEQPTADFSAPTGMETVETPDWLASLGGMAPAAAPTQPERSPTESTPSAGVETPDWLSSLGGFEAPAQPSLESTSAPTGGDLPGWLSGSEETPATHTPEPPAPIPAEIPAGDLPDWLADLQGASTTPAPETPAPATFETPASDLPDWMSGLREETPAVPTPETPAPATFETPASDLPDWMSGLQKAPATPTPETSAPASFETPASDLPDWMSGLQETAATPAAETPAPATFETPTSDLPDWMSGLQEAPAAPTPETPAPATFETPASDLPDWMSGLQETAAAPAAETPAPATFETPASDLPDWMSGLQEAPAAPAAETPAPASSETPASDLPDWMSGLQETPAAPALETPAAEMPIDSELPDWLSTAVGDKPAPTAPPAAESPKRIAKPFPTGALEEIKSLSSNETVPDFMSGLFSADEEKKPGIETTPAAEPGELPDWLAGMAAGAAATALESGTPAPAEPEKPVETAATEPESLAVEPESVPSTPVSNETPNLDSLLSMEVPDWLSGFTPSNEALPSASETPAEDANLRPAELPSWVQAMRPVESMISSVTSTEGATGEDIEKQGPLAGFRSVLPVQPELLEIRKPKAYSIKLQTNETQRSQAALLENLLTSENKPRAVAKPQDSASVRPLRWAIFAALLVAVLIPTVLGTRVFPAPAIPTDPADPFNAFYNTVDSLPANGAPVLVVTDYQPGFAGEVEQAAGPIITHLMRKNIQLVFLSTSPISTEMGERLVQKSRDFFAANQKAAPDYLVTEQYLFLGYLPGGAAGVKAFAEQPQKTTGVDSVNGDLWQSPMLKAQIANLSSFSAVIVITDDPDNGRLWIEQTDQSLADKPMLMVTSAQAGPMIRPYAASGQLNGLVVGLEDGARYESKAAQPDETYPGQIKALYWDGFGAAVMVTVLAILVGALWSLVEKFRARQDDLGQDEA